MRRSSGVAGDDAGARAAGADDDVRVGDVAGATGGEQAADVGRVHPTEGRDLGSGLSQQSGEPGLPCRVPDRLGERRAWTMTGAPVWSA